MTDLRDEPLVDAVASETRAENEAPDVQRIEFHVPGGAAKADATALSANAEFAGNVTGVHYTPADNVPEGAAFRTYEVVNLGNKGEGTNVVATLSTTAKALVVATTVAFPLNAEASKRVVAAGDVLEYVNTHTGEALEDTGGILVITIQKHPVHEGPADTPDQEAGFVGTE